MSTIVEVNTNKGTFKIELHDDEAPGTVKNFLEYVDDGHYDGTIFHRVIDGFMIQGGGYDADYERKETRDAIGNEADNGLKNERGTVAMARRGDPHSATAQFFVNVKHNVSLDHRNKDDGWGYTVFGKVVDGMDVVDAIESTPTGAQGPFGKDAPLEPVVIASIKRS